MPLNDIFYNRDKDDWESMRSLVYILRWLKISEQALRPAVVWIEEEDMAKWSDCEYCGDVVTDCDCHMNSSNWGDFYDAEDDAE